MSKLTKNIKEKAKKVVRTVKESYKRKQFFASQKNTFGLTKKEVKRANKIGFTADEYVIYDLEHNNALDYISEYERYCFRDTVRDYRIVLDNKIIWYSLIRNFARTNTIYAYKINGRYESLEKDFERENIIEQLRKLGVIVYKLMFAGGG